MAKREVDNSCGTVGVVLGIVSILMIGSLGIVSGIVGLVFSLKQKKMKKNSWANWGIGLNIVGIVLGLVAIYVVAKLLTSQLGVPNVLN
jgi:uncharacterized membrane protein HdeD (DUF308 family)